MLNMLSMMSMGVGKELVDSSKVSATVKMPNGKYVWIDSCYTLDHGYETMVFPANENGNVISWGDIYAKTYSTLEAMREGHQKICENFEKFGNGYGEE